MLMRMLQASGLDLEALQGQAETMASAAVKIVETQRLIIANQEAHSAALTNIMNRLDAIERLGNRMICEPGVKETVFANAKELSAVDEAGAQAEAPGVDEHAGATGQDGGGR